jgi:uncharacterized protein
MLYGLQWYRERQAGGAGGTDDPRGGRRRARVSWPIAAIMALAGLIIALLIAVSVWTEVLWYQEVGYAGVYWTRIWAWLLLALAGAVIFFVIFFPNLYLARRLSPRLRISANRQDDVIVELVPVGDRWVTRILLAVSLVFAVFFGLGAAGLWPRVLAFLNQTSFGFADPVFGRDASFFVFSLPVFSAVHSFVWGVLVLTIMGVIAVYIFDRAIFFVQEENRLALAPHVKGHLSVLAAVALLLKGVGYILDAWQLNYSTRGVVFGASYADVTAQLPVLRVLTVVAVISAIIFLVNIYYRGWRLPLVGVGLLVAVWILAGQIYPAIVQQYRVSPNEIQMESPYIARNIEATRFAYGLNRVTSRPFPADQQLTLEDIEQNRATVDNIRLWDPRPLLDTYRQLQEIRLYYSFRDVDVDRYTIDGNYRQVMLSAREFDHGSLQPQARTWVNEHLTFTHGYGVVVSPVNEVTGEGLPALLVQDIPPRTDTDLEITRPEIYYGEMGNEYVLVRTEALEFDYPQGEENVFTTYEGEGGVRISSLPRRVAFALRFGSTRLLVSELLTRDSRIMYHRTLQDRVRRIAPFLSYDRDPYIVIRGDGSLAWIWDAYTTSSAFPYSQPRANGLNYIRNSIKVVVDAYHGSVTFYQMDPDDAIASTWGQVYPELLTPGDQLPDDLRRNLRYPEDFFTIQAETLAAYHMTNPQTFYNREDMWEIPQEIYAGEEVAVRPYYVVLAIPGEEQEEMLLLQPFAPAQRRNMISWMAGRMDGENYGELILFQFPKQSLVFGPGQVESRISNDTEIAEQVTLWDQAGSRVIRGNLLVIPMEEGLIYIEPLYLQAQQSPLPELRRVIAAHGERVVMERDLESALEALFAPGPGRPTVVEEPEPPTEPTEPGEPTEPEAPEQPDATTTTAPTPPPTAPPGDELPGDQVELIRQAQEHFEAAEAAQRRGDWAEYGRQIEELGRVLRRLEAVQAGV